MALLERHRKRGVGGQRTERDADDARGRLPRVAARQLVQRRDQEPEGGRVRTAAATSLPVAAAAGTSMATFASKFATLGGAGKTPTLRRLREKMVGHPRIRARAHAERTRKRRGWLVGGVAAASQRQPDGRRAHLPGDPHEVGR
jgi:hypothetical protein